MLARLGGWFTGLFGFFSAYVSKKVAMSAAVFALMAALALSLYVLINGFIGGLAYALPAEACKLGWLIPSNATAALSVIVAAKLARAGYEWHVDTVKAMSAIT